MINIEQILKLYKLNITKNRIKVISALDNKDHYLTIDEIKSNMKLYNTKSIYNTLNLLIEHNIVSTISSKGIIKYGLNDEILNDHQDIHLIKNGKILHVHLDKKLYDGIINSVKKEGYKPSNIKVIVEVKD